MKGFAVLLAVIVCGSAAFAQHAPTPLTPEQKSDIVIARELEEQAQVTDAFLKYIAIPGAARNAARIGKAEPTKYLDILNKQAVDGSPVNVLLVRGDILLAMGRKPEALGCYRKCAGLMTSQDPLDPYVYPAEQTDNVRSLFYADTSFYPQSKSFWFGPGSHVDNWLIRRFIKLDAWDDAAREYARMWKINCARTQSYVLRWPAITAKNGDAKSQRPESFSMVDKHGFDAYGLRFAVDYAYFLKSRKQPAKALEVLIQPLLAMDMDRDPNATAISPIPAEDARKYRIVDAGSSPLAGTFPSQFGLTRREYIKLAFGEFKSQNMAADLVFKLNKTIAGGRTKTMRVLAQVEMLQGNIDKASTLEFNYIKALNFDAASAACRNAMIYEAAKQPEKATAEYEKALTYKDLKLSLPVEEDTNRGMFQMMPAAQDARVILTQRLQGLYEKLGQPDKALNLELTLAEVSPEQFGSVEKLQLTKKRFDAAGRSEEFAAWAKNMSSQAKCPTDRACVLFTMGDYKETANALAQAVSDKGSSFYYSDTPQSTERLFNQSVLWAWADRFGNMGTDKLREMLATLAQADPSNVHIGLQVLNASEKIEGPEAIRILEQVTDPRRENLFQQGKGQSYHGKITSRSDATYRLMGLYEKAGRTDAMFTLALSIAAVKPLTGQTDRYPVVANANDIELAEAALALAIARTDDPARQSELSAALKTSYYMGARDQLARKMAGESPKLQDAKPFEWANLPKWARLIASNMDVLCLCTDGKQVYVGYPWGVAVYDLEGNPIKRIALRDAAVDLTAKDGSVWVATPVGVYSINAATLAVASLSSEYITRANAIAVQGDMLWIGANSSVCRYDIKKNELRVFPEQELQATASNRWNRFLFDRKYVWVTDSNGCRRYDPSTDKWEATKGPGGNWSATQLVGLVDGQMWVEARDYSAQTRPCIVDRASLEVTPVAIIGDSQQYARSSSSRFSYSGRLDGKPVFETSDTKYVFEPSIGKLRPIGGIYGSPAILSDTDAPPGLPKAVWRKPDGTIEGSGFTNMPQGVFAKSGMVDKWSAVKLPGGGFAVGLHIPSSYNGDFASDTRSSVADESWGGLYFIGKDGQGRCVSAERYADAIPGSAVYGIVPDGDSTWLCTSCGVALLDKQFNVVSTATRRNGLFWNRITSGLKFGDKLYFCAKWGESGGGLVVYDPKTTLFTSKLAQDGLAGNGIDAIGVADNRIQISYRPEYIVSGQGWNNGRRGQFPPNYFDPATSTFSQPGEPINPDSQPQKWQNPPADMPFIGGVVLSRQVIGDKTIVCGSRGLLIYRGKTLLDYTMGQITPKAVGEDNKRLLEQAERIRTGVGGAGSTAPDNMTAADLRKLLSNENPYVRANELVKAMQPALNKQADYFPVFRDCMADPNPRVRTTALWLLTKYDDAAVIGPLQDALKDDDKYVRALAAIKLARLGRVPDLSYFEEILADNISYGNLPFGAASTVGVETRPEQIYAALAANADKKVFELMMKYPMYAAYSGDQNSSECLTTLQLLGKALVKHPEALNLLLGAVGTNGYVQSGCSLARAIMRYAGQPILPSLHKALGSEDYVAVTNAAYACGAIGDSSSIPYLIKVLDAKDGFQVGGAAWALAKLRARQALPKLTQIYMGTIADDQIRLTGVGISNAARTYAPNNGTTIASIDDIASEWDRIKGADKTPAPASTPISGQDILANIREIGPEYAQDFYRALATGKDFYGRKEAALGLASCTPQEKPQNVKLLKGLLADGNIETSLQAAASLIILGDSSGERWMLEALSSEDSRTWVTALNQIWLIRDITKIEFARKTLRELAGRKGISSDTRKRIFKLLGEPETPAVTAPQAVPPPPPVSTFQ